MSEPAGRGDAIVVSAPSGSGKTTLCKRLLEGLPGIRFSVSHTTRAPRAGEVDGVDYHFFDRPEFEALQRQGAFLEWAVVGGELYGTADAAVREALARGTDVLLDLDTQGAESVRRALPGAVLVFIMPPGREALRRRLAGRGTDSAEAQARRLGFARGEIEKASMYDYVVFNDDLEAAYDRLRSIVVAARCGRDRQAERVRGVAAGFGIADPGGG